MNRAGRIGEFRADGDIFHEEKAPVWKRVDKPLQAALKADLIIRHPRAVIVIVAENVGPLAIALARRLPLPVSDQDHNSQRWALSKEFDEFEYIVT